MAFVCPGAYGLSGSCDGRTVKVKSTSTHKVFHKWWIDASEYPSWEWAKPHIHSPSFFGGGFVLSPAGSVFLVYLLWNRHNTHTHTHTHTPTIHLSLPAGRYTWLTGNGPKKKMDRYRSNHMVLSWHGGHRHGNSMVIGQAGPGTHTHTVPW